MKDQVTSLSKIGISATYVTDIEAVGKSKKREIENGEYQIVFVSPEVLFCGTELYRTNPVKNIWQESDFP